MAKYKRVPLKPIEEFKWHTRIIKTFGKKALIIYTAFPRTGAPVDEEQLSKLIEDEQSRKGILDFMLSNGLIELAEGEGAPAERLKARAAPKPEEAEEAPKEGKKEEEIAPAPEKEEEKEEIAPAPEKEEEKEEIAPEAEERPRTRFFPQKRPKPEEEEKIEIVPEYEQKEEEIAPEGEKAEKEGAPEGEKEEEIAPAPEKEEEKEEIAPEAEEKPRTRFFPQKRPKPEEEEKPKEEEEAPEAEAEEAKEEIQPEEEMEAAPKAEEAPEEEAAAGREEEAEEKPEAEAAPEEEEVKITSEHEEAEEEEEKGPSLTPAEMIVHDKYGEQGVLIFRLIDGKRSVADVAKESGATQDKVMEVLKYLDEVGLISLGGAGAEKEAKGAAETQEEKFAPLSEEQETSPITIDEQKEGIKFAKIKPGSQFISKMKVKMSVVFKFGKSGREVLEYLDSKKEANAVHLVIKLSLPINTVEAILAYLKTEGFIDLGFMQRDEIRKEFGYDAYIMYKRYGKKGVIFYEVIDKEIPLKQIADLISEKEPARIIEIFKLIRDVLGIDLPINEEAIKKELFS